MKHPFFALILGFFSWQARAEAPETCETIHIFSEDWRIEHYGSLSVAQIRSQNDPFISSDPVLIQQVMHALRSTLAGPVGTGKPIEDVKVFVDCYRTDGQITTYIAGLFELRRPPDKKFVPITEEFRKIFTIDRTFVKRIKAMKQRPSAANAPSPAAIDSSIACEQMAFYSEDGNRASPLAPIAFRRKHKPFVTSEYDVIDPVMRLLTEAFDKPATKAPAKDGIRLLVDCHRWDGSITTFIAGASHLRQVPVLKRAPLSEEFWKIFTIDSGFAGRIKELKKKT